MDDDLKELYFLYKNTTDSNLSRRYHVVLLFKTGKTKKELSELFFVDEKTVASWIKKWEYEKSVRDQEKSGRPPKLTAQEEQELCEIVDKNSPDEHGFNLSVWDCPELAKLCSLRFKKEISAESVRRILLKSGFSYRKIDYLFIKCDEDQRREYVREVVNLHDTTFQDTEIYFADEMVAKAHSKQGYIWSRTQNTVLRTLCSHEKVVVSGGVNLVTGNCVNTVADKNNSETFINFLKEVDTKKEKENVIIYVDNYRVHYSKKVLDFLELHPHIQIRHTPKYSPDLNPQEWFWGYVRKKCLNSYVFKSIEDLKSWILEFCSKVEREVVKSVCSFKIFEDKYIF